MSPRARAAAGVAAALLALGITRAASAPPWPDDWDGIGFVLSIGTFDLDRFMPHAPGYPVYVALLRTAALVVRDPVAAANAVAVACGVIAVGLVGWAAARTFDRERAWWAAGMAAIAPLAWRTSCAIGSEAPALGLAAAMVVGATFAPKRAAWWMGIAAGLGLGVRLSWAPLFVALLALAPRGARARAWAIAAGATLAWAAPFVAIVGPRHLAALAGTHASGHFRTWGGTAVTEPGASARAAYLARDLFVDGLGAGGDALGIAIGVAVIALAVLGLAAWRARGWAHARYALVVAPYLAWIAVGQNLREQPRHALPIVVALALALGLAAATSRAARGVGAALVTLVAVRTASDARARRVIPPPGVQLAQLAASLPEAPRVAVYAGPSARFFALEEPGLTSQTVGTLGDAKLGLGRLSSLPKRVLVTSELAGIDRARDDTRPGRDALVPLAHLCRPDRIERRAPCLDVYDWRLSFLRAP